MTERGPEFTHDRLRKARRSVARVLNNGTLFTVPSRFLRTFRQPN